MRDVKGANGFIVARVDSAGNITLGADAGPIVGRATNAGEIFDDDAGVHQIGRVDGEGNVINMQYETIGKVDAWGRVYDRSGSVVGNVEKQVDAGVLMLLAEPPSPSQAAPPTPEQETALMREALEMGEEQRYPKIRTDYKPLTDRDLHMEQLPRDSGEA